MCEGQPHTGRWVRGYYLGSMRCTLDCVSHAAAMDLGVLVCANVSWFHGVPISVGRAEM